MYHGIMVSGRKEHVFNRHVSHSAITPLLLTAVLLFSPLVTSYAWSEGRHANENQLHRHHLLEQLAPNSHHHPADAIEGDGTQDLEGQGLGSNSVTLGGTVTTPTPIMFAAVAPTIVNYLQGVSALPTIATSSIILSSLLMLIWLYLLRPQNQPLPLERPPATSP
jgi:hypothetical protein